MEMDYGFGLEFGMDYWEIHEDEFLAMQELNELQED